MKDNLEMQIGKKYKHIIKDGTVYLGLPDGISVEDLPNLPLPLVFSNLYPSLLKLDMNDRVSVIYAMEKQEERKKKEKVEKEKNRKKRIEKNHEEEKEKMEINLFYWDILIDFIFTYYGKSLYQIAGDILDYWKANNINEFDDQRLIYDRLNKIKNIKFSPQKETINTVNAMFEVYGLSGDILKTGAGDWTAHTANGTFKLKLQIVMKEENSDDILKDFIDHKCGK